MKSFFFWKYIVTMTKRYFNDGKNCYRRRIYTKSWETNASINFSYNTNCFASNIVLVKSMYRATFVVKKLCVIQVITMTLRCFSSSRTIQKANKNLLSFIFFFFFFENLKENLFVKKICSSKKNVAHELI